MASFNSSADICRLSPELLTLILSYLPAKSVLNVSETCKHLNKITFGCDVLWKRLCKLHYQVDLHEKSPFSSFYYIYQLVYKYRVILRNHVYGSYIPEYFYHWSILLGTERLFFSGMRYLINSRFKKTWDIHRSDISKVSDNYNTGSIYDSIKALKAKFGNNQEEFQKAVLQRCIRNQKKILQHFVTASVHGRSITLHVYIRDNPEVKNVVMTKTPIPKFLEDFDEVETMGDASLEFLPKEIGLDFIKGHFHKTGLVQVKNYVKFVQILERKCRSNKSLTRNIDVIATGVYMEFQEIAKLRLITYDEYLGNAEEYFGRVDEIDQWQSEIKEKSKFYFNADGLQEHEAYQNYILHGIKADLASLKNHFEGLHNIRIWLRKNYWIDDLLSSTLRSILEGKPCEILIRKIYEEIFGLVHKYLQTGQTKHFRKIIKKLWLHATHTLESKAKYLYQLQEDLNNKNVFPFNDWLQEKPATN